MKRLTTNAPLAAVVLAAACAVAAAAEKGETPPKCLLWQVRSSSATVYLLGSIHYGDDSLYPLDPAIEQAFERSDFLVTEINPNPANRRQGWSAASHKGVYPPGESLEGALAAPTLEKLKAYLASRSMALADVNHMRPWLVSVQLMQREAQRTGFSTDLGIDMHFLKKAVAQRKRILEMETTLGQVALMAGGRAEVQERALRDALDYLPRFGEALRRFARAWRDGDAEAIARFNEANRPKDPLLAERFEKRIEARNVRMTDRVETYLESTKTYFVVVGCLHLVGPNGIVQRLRDAGHTVRQLEKTAPARPVPFPTGTSERSAPHSCCIA